MTIPLNHGNTATTGFALALSIASHLSPSATIPAMTLTIIGSDVSTCTRRVKVVLFEKGVDFVVKPIDWVNQS
ncbi:hypothetical protein M407DRAFT_31104 [Tulasnella calospora MUT 4182]|uniref:GST N-terminal domain-containing protein n=1 Tax=Tulasnella calospora MUT 4182 TaxID=1051891 RepID=A0A0C3Q668_9AGAM|nr:hypothetical protein M407DRAFT_31104 [Tulasnella calospora MUT 4182]